MTKSGLARTAVLEAVIVCREAARGLAQLGRIAKADHSPVTVADFAVQAARRHRTGACPARGTHRDPHGR